MPVILEKHKIAYFNIPKAASTSIKHAFYIIEHGRPFQPGDGGASHIHEFYKGTFPVTAADYAPLEAYWKFTVLRDPIKRILSAYRNRVIYHRDMHKIPRARWRAALRGLSLDPSLETFILKLDQYRAFSHSMRKHTELLSTYIGPDLSRLDTVYRSDELPRLTTDLSARLGMKITLPHERTGGPPVDLCSLSRRGYEALLAYTAPEYEMLAGIYTPPVPDPSLTSQVSCQRMAEG